MLDVQLILEDYNIQFVDSGKHTTEGWVNITCPFCDDHSFHGGFNLAAGSYHCWRCGSHDSLEIFKALLGEEELKIIFNKYNVNYIVNRNLNRKEKYQNTEIEVPDFNFTDRAKKYIQKRGFDPDYLIEKYKLRYGGNIGEWKFSIIIPVYYQNQIVTFQGRKINKKEYKILSDKKSIIPAKDILYNLDNCKGDMITIVEGVFDVFRMGDGFAATFGTSFTQNQISKIRKYKKINIVYDPEPEAQKKAEKLASELISSEVEIIDLEINCDPGELDKYQALEVRRFLGYE